MDWDDDVNDDDLVDESLSGATDDVLLGPLPDGAPGENSRRVPRKLTEEDKKTIQRLREKAVQLANARADKLYCHSFLRDVLEALEKGKGCEHVFRYIAVHGHKASAAQKWCRILPQHRGEKGKKYEVYRLVDLDDEIESPACGCALCHE